MKVAVHGAHPQKSARETTEIENDSRRALQALEVGVLSSGEPEVAGPGSSVHFTLQVAQDSIQRKAIDLRIRSIF